MGVSQNLGILFGDIRAKDYTIWGSTLGFPYLGKVPYKYDYGGL